MSEREVFEGVISGRIETLNESDALESLVSEFPEELHDRLWEDIVDFNDATAKDYLVAKLLERKIAMLPQEYTEIPKFMEVINDNPEEIQESLDRAHERGSEFMMGAGENGEVVASTRDDEICYKTLFLERARMLGVNVAREALVQNAVHSLLQGSRFSGRVPAVSGFVKNSEVQAIKMEKMGGFSLRQHMDSPEDHPLPEGFDADDFFEELEELVGIINNAGYFHRDLVGNAGNVMVNVEGAPVLIDFGSSIKAFDYDPEQHVYQIVPNGQYYKKNDLSGIALIKKRFLETVVD